MRAGGPTSNLGLVLVFIASALGVGVVPMGPASSVSATTLVHASVEQLCEASELVVEGVITNITPAWGGPNDRAGIFSRVTLRVDEAWLGAPSIGGDHVAFYVHGGRIGERAMRVHGQATFEVGERVVAFLFRDGEALFPTGMSQGKWLVRADSAGVEMAASSAEPRALVVRDPSRGIAPYAGAPEVMTLARLRARVRAASQAR